MTKLAIIGGGNMGEALLAGMLAGPEPKITAADVVVVELAEARAAYLRERYGVATTAEAGPAIRTAETVLLVVKPYHVDDLFAAVADDVNDSQLFVSAVGGVRISKLEALLPGKPAVVRCMPNTPVSVGRGVVAISAGTYAGEAELDRAQELFDAVGKVVRVEETRMDAITALSGSGPAYYFFLTEAMIEAGILLGLPRPLAEELVLANAAGAAEMLQLPDADPVRMRAAVTSPGGATIAAIRQFEERGVRAAVMAAIEAARDRAAEMGR
ncbi:pyrroline-5-carboxylate reductase [Amycolatopsis rhabdoformis]|uniref:Pyrroline-5-carboxylate reductase n=1 Tax=Amycolatopsis rhabdoformis TaxID=1448059 RepID=A0ABZ1IBE0_9PSEU|nr:pyrroline-5-carboxylate reductase [Amycolatopsis rhabdoformis]WSE31785.1 pyrroline-5-carboxylate reductase [Amycolatopsis rhabdoformis]